MPGNNGHAHIFRPAVTVTSVLLPPTTEPAIMEPTLWNQTIFVLPETGMHDRDLDIDPDIWHNHWRDVEAPAAWQHYVIGVYVMALGFVAVIGNALVIWACIR